MRAADERIADALEEVVDLLGGIVIELQNLQTEIRTKP